jgi:proline dehydrogenase
MMKSWTFGRRLADRAARGYTAGATLEELERACCALHRRGLLTTACYWNRDTDSPEQVAAAFDGLLDTLSGQARQSYLSVKAPALGFDLRLLQTIAERARRLGLLVHFDALAPETASRTFRLISQMRREGLRLGVTLPSRWHRSIEDVEEAIENGFRIRIVKGEWPDATGSEVDLIDGFLNLVNRTAARARSVAVATHDVRLAQESLRRLKAARTPCELELRYGYPLSHALHVARAVDAPARIYVPFGRAWLPYRLHTAPQQPRVLFWFLRDLIRSLPS